MLKRKNIKAKGKLRLSQYFQEFKDGERVAVVREQSLNPQFPHRMQGRSGVIVGKKGNSYLVDIMDFNEKKTFIIEPIHLKKLNSIENKQ
jgi:large subunit ribosomal protein L21e